MTSMRRNVRTLTGCAMLLGVTFVFWRSAPTVRLDATSSADKSPASVATEETEREHRGHDHPEGWARFRHAIRADADGNITPNALIRAGHQAAALRRADGGVADGGISPSAWTWLGPGNIGGRVRALLIHPTSPLIMWAGSVGGGIWKTVNGGASWLPLDDFMANLAVSTMVMHPSDPNTFYVGTGEGFFNTDAIQGAGVFKCINGGSTCTQLSSTGAGSPNESSWYFVNRLAIDPGNPRHILAATNDGIFETHDEGGCWSQRTTVRTLYVAFDPTDGTKAVAGGGMGEIWFAANSSAFRCGGRFDWTDWTRSNITGSSATASLVSVSLDPDSGSRDRLVLDSTDGFRASEPIMIGTGATQETVNVQRIVDETQLVVSRNLTPGHGSGEAVVTVPFGRVELAYFGRPPADDLVYASMNVGDGSVLSSTNGGQDFSFVARTAHLGGAGWYANALWVDPTNSNRLVLGGVGIYRSSDGGATTENIGCGAHGDNHVLVAHPDYDGVSNKVLFNGGDGGIFLTEDILSSDVSEDGGCGRNFGWVSRNNLLGITQFYGGRASPGTGLIFGGTQDNKTLVYSGEINGWTEFGGGDGGICAMGPVPTTFYGEYSNMDIFRSTDAGGSVEYITDTGDCGEGSLLDGNRCRQDTSFIAPFISDPNDRNRIIAGGARLWRSNDAGTAATPTWEIIRDHHWIDPPGTPNRQRRGVSAMTIVDGNSDDMWVGYANGDLFRTVNGTAPSPIWARWDDIGSGLPRRWITDIVVDTHSPQLVYVSFSGYNRDNLWALRPDATGTLVWESASGSGSDRIPAAPIMVMTVHPNNPGWLYVGTDVGIFASENDGATWSGSNDGPANVEVDDLDWQNDETLIAFTHGRGVYRATGIIPDCNGNGRSDHLDLGDGTLSDCNLNRIPDECEAGDTRPDCNSNLVPDECEISVSSSAPGGPFFCVIDCQTDCDDNGIPDSCDPDCDGNGQPDTCDLSSALTFVRMTQYIAGEAPNHIASADFDDDGFGDLAVANWESFDISVLLNRGNNAAGDWLGYLGADNYSTRVVSAAPWAVTTGDFDLDGDEDIAFVVESGDLLRLESDLGVMLNNGSGAFSWPGFTPIQIEGIGPHRCEDIVAGDLDGDGFPELIVVNTSAAGGISGNKITIIPNRGLNTSGVWREFGRPLGLDAFPIVGLKPVDVALGRFNADGFLDIAVANEASGDVSILINDGTGVFSPATSILLGTAPTALGVRDLNGDGFDDLVVGRRTSGSLHYLRSNGDGTFASQPPLPTDLAGVDAITLADIDLEDSVDIAAAQDSGVNPSILLNDSLGGFGLPFRVAIVAPIVSMTTVDVDGDGDLDLVSVGGNTASRVVVVLNDTDIDCNRNGVPDNCEIASGRPDSDGDGLLDQCEVGACDADGDGDCDLADYRRMHACWRGPDIPCGATAGAGLAAQDLDHDFDFDLRDFAILQNSFTMTRDCCETHGPGCHDYETESCVCEVLPDCCTVMWDETCVAAVSELECGVCVPPIPCGDGSCDAVEDCFNCPRDCGPCDGLCCEANGTPGCDDPFTQSCVCDLMAQCCDDTWSQPCADAAATACDACCGNGACEAGETCTDCPVDCGECDPFCGNDRCEAGENCSNCPLDCRECVGNCCFPNPTPGCVDRTVMTCVCATKPACCSGLWGGSCAVLASGSCSACCGDQNCGPGENCASCPVDCDECPSVCGDNACTGDENCASCPGDCGPCVGSCCLAHATPGCDNLTTQACVCAFDPVCCTGIWDNICAGEADECGACLGDCCAANGTPGCSDNQIELCVCASVPACCIDEWKIGCADAVDQLLCGSCVNSPPTVAITTPAQDTDKFDANFIYDGFDEQLGLWFKDVTLAGQASDPEDGALTGASLVWATDRTDIQPGGTGFLNAGSPASVRLYSDVAPTGGVWHKISLTATDSQGSTAIAVRRIFIWSP